MEIGYLGPDTVSFGYLAAKKYFDKEMDIKFIPYPSHYEIAVAVGKKEVKYGVVAIENVIDGVVAETVHAIEDVASKFGLFVCGEIVIPVNLYYMRKELKEEPPKKVISHASPIGQCRKFISELQNQGITVEVRKSTSEAAKEASENSEIAVIASIYAEQLYNLKKVQEASVEDNKDNMTRFWVIGKEHADKTDNDKTVLLVNLQQAVPGSLCKTLDCFKDRNLLLIYPNPIPGRHWEYTFLLEIKGHINDLDRAWQNLRDSGLILGQPKFLGSYHDASCQVDIAKC